MDTAVHSCVVQCGWKLRLLLRTQRFHTDSELVILYKAHILSYIEFRTAALAHAASSVLAPLDAVQSCFLHSVGVSDIAALFQSRLAPLSTRRDMALLTVIHRSVVGDGPACLRNFFRLDTDVAPARAPRRHARHVHDPRAIEWPDLCSAICARSCETVQFASGLYCRHADCVEASGAATEAPHGICAKSLQLDALIFLA
eukprot:UN4797